MAEQNENRGPAEAGTELPFGEDLRREREMREISIREISETTKISTRFLEAIEQGEFSSLPAPVFTRGFIREYASYLGLDAEEIVDRYMSIVERQEKQLEHEEEEMRDRISGRLPLGPGSGALKWIVIAIIAIAILGAGVYYVSTSDSDQPETGDAGEQVSRESESVSAAEPVEAPPVTTAESVQVRLTASGDSWVDVQVDDDPPADFTLQAGGSRTFDGNQKILLRTVGNAGVVAVELNGVKLEPLGREGQVVRNLEYDLEMANELLQRQRQTSPESRTE